MTGAAACALFAYCVWAFQLPTAAGFPWRPLSIVPFALGLARYQWLVVGGAGEAPEDVLLSDRLIQAIGAGWLIVFALGVHAAS